MSTSYNNQWVLGHAHSRWRRLAPVPDSGALGQPPISPPRKEHERQPSPAGAGPRPALNRPVRKRPRWIDRDT